MSSYVKFGIGVILSFLMLKGTFDLIQRRYPNRCEMTYMYQLPQFIKINVSTPNIPSYNYSLYAYGEGQYAQELKDGDFSGIPVLFIPGNQGSYKQVRSLASVAFRKARDERRGFHFNYFSVDFNEEPSAFYGAVLDTETEFVGLAIRRIFELYKSAKRKPNSIILIGHSLGGLVARAVVMLPEIPASLCPLIISIGTPHTRPVINTDYFITEFYDKVNAYWELEKFGDFQNIILVSVAGGRNDIQVPNHFTSYSHADVDVSTLSVPSCWLTTDHLALVWCRQLILAITRALFHSIDQTSNVISSNRRFIVDAFKYQLVSRSASRHSYPLEYPSNLNNFDKNGIWFEITKHHHHHEFVKPSKHNFLMIPLIKGDENYKHLAIIGREFDWKNWVFACKTDGSVQNGVNICSSGINLSMLGHIIPGNKKEVNINLDDLMREGMTHVVIWVHPSDDKIKVAFDISDYESRNKNVSAPEFMSFRPVSVTKVTMPRALSFNLTLSGFSEFWQSYLLSVVPNKPCSQRAPSTPYVSISSSWTNRWEYLMMTDDGSYKYSLEIDTTSVNRDVDPDSKRVYIHIILYQNCTYDISLEKSFTGIFRRISLLYGLQFPAYAACHFLLVLSTQLKSLALNKKCSSVFSSILALSPIIVVPFVKLLSFALMKLHEVESDLQLLGRHNVDLGVLPIMLFLAFLPVSLIFAAALWILVIWSGNASHSFAVRLLKKAVRTGDFLTEIAVAGFWKIPAIAAVGLLAVAMASCGSLALCIASFLYFIKVFRMYESYLESLLMSFIPVLGRSSDQERSLRLVSIHFHFTVMILSLIITLMNIPTLVMWIKIMQTGAELPADPSFIPCVLCILSLGTLWQIKQINPHKILYKELGYFVHIIAVLVLLFGIVHIYRISYFVSVVLLVLALHQLFAPSETLVVVNSGEGPNLLGEVRESSSQDEVYQESQNELNDQSSIQRAHSDESFSYKKHSEESSSKREHSDKSSSQKKHSDKSSSKKKHSDEYSGKKELSSQSSSENELSQGSFSVASTESLEISDESSSSDS